MTDRRLSMTDIVFCDEQMLLVLLHIRVRRSKRIRFYARVAVEIVFQ